MLHRRAMGADILSCFLCCFLCVPPRYSTCILLTSCSHRKGNQAFARKQYSDAIDLYTEAIKRDQLNHVYFSNRSASYAGLKDWESAATDAKECIRLDPNFIKGYYRLALAQIELNDYEKAISTIRQGLSIDPNNPQLTKQMNSVLGLRKPSAVGDRSIRPSGNDDLSLPEPVGQLDEAATSELQDLQTQFVQMRREAQTIDYNINQLQRQARLGELTKDEVALLPEGTNCFRSVGKVFLASTKSAVLQNIELQVGTCRKREMEMKSKAQYLEKRMNSLQENISELIASSSTL